MNRAAGFTLLEVLVAVVLVSLLLSSIYGVFFTTSEAKEQVEKQANALHLGRVLSSRLNRELLGLALENRSDKAIISGGVNDQGEPYLEFLTSSTGGSFPGMRWAAYRLGPDQDNRTTLWRSEQGLNSLADVAEDRLAQGIEQLAFGFYDGSSWRDTWNSFSDGRPQLVRVEITLTDLPETPPLLSVFSLSQGRPR